MRLLLIGGTVFLGRHLVEAALTRGHEVTLFHRGRQMFEHQANAFLGYALGHGVEPGGAKGLEVV